MPPHPANMRPPLAEGTCPVRAANPAELRGTVGGEGNCRARACGTNSKSADILRQGHQITRARCPIGHSNR
eukprot:2798305-Pyramimonas_sp.AAC.1